MFYADSDFELVGGKFVSSTATVSITPSQNSTGGVQVTVTDGTTQYAVADRLATADAQEIYDDIIAAIQAHNASNSSGDTLSSVGNAAILYKDDTSSFVHNGVGFNYVRTTQSGNTYESRWDIVGATGGETALYITYNTHGDANGRYKLAINGALLSSQITTTQLLARVAEID